MFNKILIANRGEIACRIIKTARRLGIRTVAVYSAADENARHVKLADEAVYIGAAPASESYLNIETLIKACLTTGAEAIHPGYGFLSENPAFVEATEAAGLTFIGPSASAIRAMGLKDAAKALMEKAGVPIVPGYHGEQQDEDFLQQQANQITYPVLIKARAGGGGKGMRLVENAEDFSAALKSAKREAKASFGDDAVLIEKYMTKPRHIEVQVFGDSHGHHVHLFERDCSLQRRHQKVIEEAPAPDMTPQMRALMGAAAVKAAAAIEYCGAGTVEFIADVSEGLREDRFFFMEMNTRLQVEHPVTEAITGLDLVEWQLRVAAGETLPKTQDQLGIEGWAFEARIYAEDPNRDFMPATGALTGFDVGFDDVRIDTGVEAGDNITPFYDPMIAKLITHGRDRAEALAKLKAALKQTQITGLTTNRQFLLQLAQLPEFAEGDVDTGLIARNHDVLFVKPQPDDITLALAALAALNLLTPPQGTDPWHSLRGFRLWETACQHAALDFDNQRHHIKIGIDSNNAFRFDFGALKIKSNTGNQFTFSLQEKTEHAYISQDDSAVFVMRDGCEFTFQKVKTVAENGDDTGGGSRLISPMPGVVTMINIAEGDMVTKGDTLIIMEAMKMELSLCAPRDGIVKALNVVAGDQVSDGAVLLELEEEQ